MIGEKDSALDSGLGKRFIGLRFRFLNPYWPSFMPNLCRSSPLLKSFSI